MDQIDSISHKKFNMKYVVERCNIITFFTHFNLKYVYQVLLDMFQKYWK